MPDIFGDQPINDDVTVDILVGEGKKYTDVNNLAKGYVNAENFIEELKRELALERAQKDANTLNNTDGSNQQQTPTPPTSATPSEPVKPQSPEDLRTLISEEVANLAQSKRFEENIESTASRMVEVYGSPAKAQEALAAKAKELGVNVEWLRDAAARSPSAFYATMGIPSTPQTPTSTETPAPRSDVRVSPVMNGGEKNYNYFQELRRTNKSQYYSTETQAEMHRLAREKGDAFYT
jgi:hypothetical protein